MDVDSSDSVVLLVKLSEASLFDAAVSLRAAVTESGRNESGGVALAPGLFSGVY